MNAPADRAEDPAAEAWRWAWFMLSGDRPAGAFGFELVAAGPGAAELAMTVPPVALNAFGTCHGGVLFTLADAALSIACNSRGQQSVAQTCSIAFLRPVQAGDRLIARASERARTARTAIYDCAVVNGATGKVVAEFRGHSRTIAGHMPSVRPPETG